MVRFCDDIMTGAYANEKEDLQKTISRIHKWYCDNYEKYSIMLKQEMGYSVMYKDLKEKSIDIDLFAEFTDEYIAKVSYFNVAEVLMRFILSKYAYGPSNNFWRKHNIDYTKNNKKPDEIWCSWRKFVWKTVDMVEAVTKILKDEKAICHFDLKSIFSQKEIRNRSTHALEKVDCLGAIRAYNSIRQMLIFLDEEEENILPKFEAQPIFSYDKFLSSPCDLNFEDYTTILVTDTVHDINLDDLSVVSNLYWDIVVDLDGCSDQGGFLSSINHNCYNKNIISLGDRPSVMVNRGKTTWIQFGEYLQFEYSLFQKEQIYREDACRIPEYTSFITDFNKGKNIFKRGGKDLSNIFEKIIQAAFNCGRPLNIVVLTDKNEVVESIINSLNAIDRDDYFLSWIGLSAGDPDDIVAYYSDEEECAEHFRYLFSPISQFFSAFAEHKMSWEQRKQVDVEYSLPGEHGNVPVPENIRNILEFYFDVLYKGCENLDSEDKEGESSFYNGGKAKWSDIANADIILAKPESDYNAMLQEIRTILGKVQDNPMKYLYFIGHKPGMGGTTLARQIAWSLHTHYAVLNVRYYEKNKFVEILQNLYDNVIEKTPIVIIAEDTLAGLDNLCEDIMALNRRCILIIACRETNGILKKYKRKNGYLLSLSDSVLKQIQNRFYEKSPLSQNAKDSKKRNFDVEIEKSIRTPFIIGLYYMEEHFNIKDYISKALSNDYSREEIDLLACLALCDRYNAKEVSASFVQNALKIKDNSFFRNNSAASSLLCKGIAGNIDEYHFKHTLLSKEFLRAYCLKYFDAAATGEPDERDMLFYLGKYLIHNTACIGLQRLLEQHLNILISVIIQKQADFSEQSDLLNDIGRRESQSELLEFLANEFKPIVDPFLSCDNQELQPLERHLRRIVSHAYAHLGKLYTTAPVNNAKAIDNLKLAKNYMPDDDPVVYHMYGMALSRQLQDEWNSIGEYADEVTEFELYEVKIREAIDCFDSACQYGSPEYGLPSELALLNKYFLFVYRAKHINKPEDIDRLSSGQRDLQTLFLDILAIANTYSGLSDNARRLIYDEENQFNATKLQENGKAIEYYNNQVENYSKDPNSNIAAWESALRGLVLTKINTARDGEKIDYYRIDDPKKIFDYLTELIRMPINGQDYSERRRKGLLFHHWMQLGKVVKCSVDDGLKMARRWYELEELVSEAKNPEPYYYLHTLMYLDKLDGTQNSEDISELSRKIQSYIRNNRFDSLRGNPEKMKDLLIKGVGMGRLLDISGDRSTVGIARRLKESNACPYEADAHMKEIIFENTAIGQLYLPREWDGYNVRMEIGKETKNTITSQSRNHKIRFFIGFSVKQLIAVADSIKDLNVGEELIFSEFVRLYAVNKSVSSQPEIKISKGFERNKIYCFTPENTFVNRQTGITYLNGYVDGVRAGLSIADLDRYGVQLKEYPDKERIFDYLESLDSIDCKILSQNAKGYYQISVYEANPVLEQLMEMPALSKERVISENLSMNLDSAPAILGISSAASIETENRKAALPDLKGKTFSFIPEKGHTNYIEGFIEVVQDTDKIVYPARTNTISKSLKDLIKRKKPFKVKVIDINSDNYIVKKV